MERDVDAGAPAANACGPGPSDEQLLYARVLRVGMVTGLVTLAITYAVYVSGVLEPHTQVQRLSEYYADPAPEYLAKAGVRPGWAHFLDVAHGDSLCYLGIVVLAGTTVVCYLAVLPGLVRRRDAAYAAIAVVEIVVLVLAASGLLTGGH